MLNYQEILAKKRILAKPKDCLTASILHNVDSPAEQISSAKNTPLNETVIPTHAYSSPTVRMAVSNTTLRLLMDNIHEQTKPYYAKLQLVGWRFVLANQSRGWCQSSTKTITYPMWLLKKSKVYQQWYIAHEIAHAYAGQQAKHGLIFMEWLKKICPDASIHFELTYKPRNAFRAGIYDFSDL